MLERLELGLGAEKVGKEAVYSNEERSYEYFRWKCHSEIWQMLVVTRERGNYAGEVLVTAPNVDCLSN